MSKKIKMPRMTRGRTQALYKYLPGEWIDFSVSAQENGRDQYTAKVCYWDSDILDGINTKRVIRLVNQAIQSYRAQDTTNSKIAPVYGFGDKLTINNCEIRTPKESVDINNENEKSGIYAKIDPLNFYCNECKKIYEFKNEEEYERSGKKCEICKKPLSQFRQIYYCECGYATSQQPSCDKHGASDLYWFGSYENYEFKCKKCGASAPPIEMKQVCPICGKTLYPQSVLASAQFFPYSLHLIDLIDEKLENFISENDNGIYITLAYWMGEVSKEELENSINRFNPEQYNKKYEEYKKSYEKLGMSEEAAENAAKAKTGYEFGSDYDQIINDVKGEILCNDVHSHAESILEYDKVLSKCQVTLQDANDIAMSLDTVENSHVFSDIAKKRGFSDIQACDDIPFITCSYGYTRLKSDYEPGVQLHAFKKEKGGKNKVYAVKDNTEGVLFEFDRRKILEWLLKNDFISGKDMPDLNSEEELKLWFINNIDMDKITTFNPIPKPEDSNIQSSVTYYVYRLIHSISHLLIRSAADIGGLGKDSLSEYIFPDIPAVLIFVQNSQGFNLGSLYNTFEAYLDEWLNKALDDAQKCIYDPICIERYKACTGCLFLNEVSCQHYNRDLDRSLVIGYTDYTNKHVYGFWEDV